MAYIKTTWEDLPSEDTPITSANLQKIEDSIEGAHTDIASGWIPVSETWTYASATTITVPAGATSKYQKGDRIKLTQTTVKYFYILNVADTVLTITGGSDYTLTSDPISNVYYSHYANPIGFPDFFNTVATFDVSTFDNGSGGQPTKNVFKFKIIGNCFTGFCSFSGFKAGTDMFIKMTSSGLPTPHEIANANVGSGNFDNTNFYVPVVFLYRSAGEFWFTNGVNITDNLPVANLSSVFSYQI